MPRSRASAREARLFSEGAVYVDRILKGETRSSSRKVKLVTPTDQIPASIGVRFGLRYIIRGQPKGATVTIPRVTRYPPQTGVNNRKQQQFRTGEYSLPAKIEAKPSYFGFTFDEA
jgi:hypothetical protein